MTGQTSQVWEVVHATTWQHYALKMLLPEYRAQRAHAGYLKHEFAVGCKLAHERVIRMHELGRALGAPFLVMEYFPFPNLKQYIVRGSQRLSHLVPKIITQAGEGLAYFNEQGWVHRDIKPDNYLVNPDGEVKLIDFALAQRKKVGLSRLLAVKSKIQGTRSYMSPEQIRGQPLDARADIYSFGCMVHELLSGKPPFTGLTSNELLSKHLRSPPPSLEAVNSNVTPQFALLVQRLLSKKPEGRPASMAEFLSEFRRSPVFKRQPRPGATEAQEEAAG